MRARLQYGTTGLDIEVRAKDVTVLEPRYLAGLPDEAAAFRDAVEHPIASPPLRELIRPTDRVAVVIPDITRPLPTDRLLPWLFAALPHVSPDRFVIVNGTGSHRANSEDELRRMVGAEVFSRYRVVNHDAHDAATLAPAGNGSRRLSGADEPRVRGSGQAHRPRLRRTSLHGRLLRRLQGDLSRGRGHRIHHALPRRQDDRPCEEHLGRSRGQPHPGHHPRQRRTSPRRLLHQPDPQPGPAHHPLLLRGRGGRSRGGLRLLPRDRNGALPRGPLPSW